MKQILYYRKQNKTIKEQHADLREQVETTQKEEEQTDRMLASKLDKTKVHMPTIMKPTKRVADALQGPVFGAMLVNSSSKGFTPANAQANRG